MNVGRNSGIAIQLYQKRFSNVKNKLRTETYSDKGDKGKHQYQSLMRDENICITGKLTSQADYNLPRQTCRSTFV